jgi:signal transduction histidine kinase
LPGQFDDAVSAIARINVVPTILEVVCRTTGMGFSAVARVTEDRWIACAVRDEISFGLEAGGELRLETTICNEIRQSGKLVVIDHVAEDDEFREHPTPQMYGFQSYISVPIRLPDGRFFGTLCSIDPRPARLRAGDTVTMFKLYADLIAMHLDAQERLSVSETALSDERQDADLREQFIAVLGHDLRNPLAAVRTGVKLLEAKGLGQDAAAVTRVIDRSAARMSALIDDILDFARARLGPGLLMDPRVVSDLEVVLRDVVNEARTVHPERTIQADIAVPEPLLCDRGRIGQLLANLLVNALTHGDDDGPVEVKAAVKDGQFVLEVTNPGEPLTAATRARLFQPFARSDQSRQDGLGLGLYIASETAKAHQGKLEVHSAGRQTRFSFSMPASSPVRMSAAD